MYGMQILKKLQLIWNKVELGRLINIISYESYINKSAMAR